MSGTKVAPRVMRISIINLTSGGMSGGYRKYLERIVPLLASVDSVERLDVLLPPSLGDVADRLGGTARCWPADLGLSLGSWLRDAVREAGSDVVFIPSARWLGFGRVPTVVMVRNMEPLSVPWDGHALSERVRNAGRRYIARRACSRATRVIAVSEHVRDFLTQRWGIGAHRIGVVRHGVDHPTQQEGSGGRSTEGFIFTAGSLRPARGLETLLRAWPRIRRARPDLRLAIAGDADRGTEHHARALRTLADRLGIAADIDWLGRVPSEAIPKYAERAIAFVMTSRAEACPNTALEAMSVGALCVSTDDPPMPEFFGDAARYYTSGSPEALTATLLDTLDRRNEHARRRAEARTRARRFTWDATLRGTLKELDTAVSGISQDPASKGAEVVG